MAYVNAKELTKEVETLVCELGVGGISYDNWANGFDSTFSKRKRYLRGWNNRLDSYLVN